MAQVDHTQVAREFIGNTVGVAYPEIALSGYLHTGNEYGDNENVISYWSDKNGNAVFRTVADNIGQYANLIAVL